MLDLSAEKVCNTTRLPALYAVCLRRIYKFTDDISIDLMELLLDRGFNPNAKWRKTQYNYRYESPHCLYTSLDLLIDDESCPKIEIVQLLLAKGSDFNLGALSRISNPTLRSTLERWQTCMAIILLQELAIYYQMDASSIIDVWLYLHG